MANIFGWIGMRDEKRALQDVGKHIEKVRIAVRLLNDAVEAALAGDQAQVENINVQLTMTEREADKIRRDLLFSLSEGLLLPPDRDDLVRLAERVDHVADDANGASRILVLFNARLPVAVRDDLQRLSRLLVLATDGLYDAFATLYRGSVENTLQKCTQVEEHEEAADQVKARLLRTIFVENEFPAAQLLMLHSLIESMENTADRAEDAADVIRNLAVKVKR